MLSRRDLRVLVVEDAPDEFVLTRSLLEDVRGAQVKVDWVSTFEEAAAAVRSGRYDVGLVDYRLGERTGLDLLRETGGSGGATPLVVLTGQDDRELDLRLMEAGAADFLVKGEITPALLERSIRYAVQRRRAEAERTRATQALSTLVEALPLAVVVLDREARVTDWNPAAERIFGWARDEVLGLPYPLVPGDRHEEFRDVLRDASEGRAMAGVETVRRRRDGALLDVALWTTPLRGAQGEVYATMGVLADVTERKRAEAAAHRRDQEFKALVENAPDVIARFDRRLRYRYVNPAVEAATGISTASMLGRTNEELGVPRRLCALWTGALRRVLETGKAEVIEFEHRVRRKGRYYQARLVPEFAVDGSVQTVLGITREFTEIREAERALRESEQRYRQLAENIGAVVWMAGRDNGPAFYVSPAYERIWGRTRESLYADPATWGRALHPDDQERVLASLAGVGDAEYEMEYRVVRPDGEVRWIRDRGFPIFNEAGRVVRRGGIAEDVTERKRAEEALRASEEQLLQAQRLEAVGKLAGGVAHDFNNILTVIQSNAELLLLDIPKDDPLRGDVVEIKAACHRGSDLTRQLLAFSRKQVLQPTVLDLNATVAEMEKLLRRVIGEDVELVLSLAARVGPVEADVGQLGQVLMNLVVNARDAMPQGGRLEIQTRNVFLEPSEAEHYPYEVVPGPYVRLTVRDSGTGMDEETLARVWEPFFTTKEQGKGTGLGLSTVYGIVKQSGGYVWAESAPGQGSIFAVYLPRSAKAPTTSSVGGAAPPGAVSYTHLTLPTN